MGCVGPRQDFRVISVEEKLPEERFILITSIHSLAHELAFAIYSVGRRTVDGIIIDDWRRRRWRWKANGVQIGFE